MREKIALVVIAGTVVVITVLLAVATVEQYILN